MATAQERFQAAVNVIKGLPKNGPYQPSTAMMLKFYGLFKQATEGPCQQRKPGFWDVINKAKWDAWNKNRALTKEEAMQKYVEGLQEIIETMSFNENVQDFVGSLQGLENINLDELGKIAPKMKELAESHPNSPFNSRTNSPQRNNAQQNGGSSNSASGEEHFSNGHASAFDIEIDIQTPPTTPINETNEQQQEEHSNSTMPNSHHTTISTYDYSQANGIVRDDGAGAASSSMAESDDEYVDPFDIQNELNESLQHNTQVLKQIQATVARMNQDVQTVNKKVTDLEKLVSGMRFAVTQSQALSGLTTQHSSNSNAKYPKWWPFQDISPTWFFFLVIWPFVVGRIGRMLAHSKRK